jgi:hypothetical protein
MRDARSERTSKTSLARVRRACRALDLSLDDMDRVFSYLDYANPTTHELYNQYKEKT